MCLTFQSQAWVIPVSSRWVRPIKDPLSHLRYQQAGGELLLNVLFFD